MTMGNRLITKIDSKNVKLFSLKFNLNAPLLHRFDVQQ